MFHDLRFAVRTLFKTPVLTLVVIGSLAIGIGANTVIFSWLKAIVLEPISGVERSAQLITVEARTASGGYPGLSWTEYGELRKEATAFESLLASRQVPLYVGEPGHEERMSGMLVSENYFTALGLRPAQGRFFLGEEVTRPGGGTVAVISHDFWQNQFHGAANVVGQRLVVNGLPLTIVGVTPAGFQGTAAALYYDVWVPAMIAPTLFPGSRELEAREIRGYNALGRLKSGATLAQADTEVAGFIKRSALAYPTTNGTMTGLATEFWRAPRGAQSMFGGALAALQAMMLLVLLLVCANSANLLLARAASRRQEIGVRMAMGAGSWRIVRQLLVEGLVLAAIAVVCGVVFASWSIDAFRSMPVMGNIPWRPDANLNWIGLGVTVLLATGCTLLFCLAPALQLSRLDVRSALHASSIGGVPGRGWLRGILIGIEIGIALVVLVITVTFVKILRDESTGDPGFRMQGTTLAAYDLTGRGYDAAALARFNTELLSNLKAIPGVEGVAISSAVPLDLHGIGSQTITIPGLERASAAFETVLSYNVTPGYFDVMGLGMVEGTDFADLADTSKPPQAVINEEFVRRYFNGVSPLGRKVEIRNRPYEITGIVRNAKYNSLSEPPLPVIYLAFRSQPRGEINLRTSTSNSTVIASVRSAIQKIDPRIVPYDVRTFSEHVDKNLYLRRVPARLFGLLGPFALILAAIGIYAIVAHAVAQRTKEIGLRLAIGASPARVVGELMLRNLRPVVIGLAVTWVLIASFTLRMNAPAKAPSLAVQGIVVLGLLLVAVLACWIPARRAAGIDPLIALRTE